ncbi:MAG: hypothetical protein GX342_03245 [Alcaligenaceae bacterium]|jgi:hypothetical protein|nr:hypothetical protein [Alcaligenaceae bacterium]
MTSPVLNRVWRQTIWIESGSYEIFYKTGVIWIALLLSLGFTTACILAALLFVFLKAQKATNRQGLFLSPEGDCRYYPSQTTPAITCKVQSVRTALFWCHLVLRAEDGQRHQLVVWLHSLTPQEKRRFSVLCHNWSQEMST